MRTHLIVFLIVVAVRAPALLAAGDPAASGLVSRAFTMRYRASTRPTSWSARGSVRAARIQSQPHQRTLTVVDTPEAMKHVAELLAGFDLPPAPSRSRCS